MLSLYWVQYSKAAVPKSKLTRITDKTNFDGILQSEIYSPVFGGMHTLNFYNKLLKALLINNQEQMSKMKPRHNEMVSGCKWNVAVINEMACNEIQNCSNEKWATHAREGIRVWISSAVSTHPDEIHNNCVTASKCIVLRTCFFSFADKPSRWFVYYLRADCWGDTGSY